MPRAIVALVAFAIAACIVSRAAAADMPSLTSGATVAYACDFEAANDLDFDLWPDGWSRRRGPGYPIYLPIEIAEDRPSDGRCLRVTLDGSGAAVFSPPLPAGPRHSFVVRARLKTDGLVHDHAWISVTFLDAHRQTLNTYDSPRLRTDGQWTPIQLGPVDAPASDAAMVCVGLHLEPSGRADLTGGASFDDLVVERLPRLTLSLDRPHHLVRLGEPIEVECRASGLDVGDATSVIVLEDAHGNELVREELQLEGQASTSDPSIQASADTAVVRWRSSAVEAGFYRLRFGLPDSQGVVHGAESTLAVLDPDQRAAFGEFGWSLACEGSREPWDDLGVLASELGLHAVKMPVWFDENDRATWDATIRLVDQLNLRNVRVIGVLGQPPAELCRRLGLSDRPPAAALFQLDPAAWYPSLEPVLLRLALKVRAWQLTDDDDTSMMFWRDAPSRVSLIHKELDRVGHGFDVGLAWDWLRDAPARADGAWQFLAMQTEPPLTAIELDRYLAAAGSGTERWVSFVPLDEGRFELDDRVADLMGRMIAAKRHESNGVFIRDPLAPKAGLWTARRTPGELLVPWRTTAAMLGGTRHAGSLELVGGSANEVFTDDTQAVMAVWSNTAQEETIDLGDKVRRVDAWGRVTELNDEQARTVAIDRVPTFITGINPAVVAWHQSVRFANQRMPSVIGVPHRNAFSVTNGFDRGVTGTVKIVPLDEWRIEPEMFDISLEPGETISRDFEATFEATAQSGKQQVRLDFDVTSGQRHRFSVYRTLEVGLGDVWVDVHTRLDNEGFLEVEQRLINQTDRPVTFRCHLILPGGRRVRSQVLDLGRGEDVQTYRIRDGEALVGKSMWLLAEEVDGARTLSYVVPIE